MPKKILIATGGTGGHIYPAMALAQQFAKQDKESQILFIGGGLSQNRYFDRNSFDHRSVSCGAFTSKSPLSILRSCVNILKGMWQSRAIIRAFKPDVIVGFGSYYSFPPLMVAKLHSVPVVLHEANSIPGKVNKLLAPYAKATGVHFPQTLGLLKGDSHEVGMPLRSGFEKGSIARSKARAYFGLSEQGKILLIFGGSQGSRVINFKVLEALKEVKSKEIQVIHVAGDVIQVQELQKGYQELGIRACVKAFEEHMEIAWQAADLVISRSGASSIAEQLEFEVPGILIPFARAADDHQNHNANFLVDTVHGAVKIQESELSAKVLTKHIDQFLDDEGALLSKMRLAMDHYKKTTRKCDLYSLIKQLINKN